jgi:L-threonylcarbamoyladenylate synthase
MTLPSQLQPQVQPQTQKRAKVLPADTPELFQTAVAQAREQLQAGQLVALPTETVYGLAANAWNANAVTAIFAAKGRPAINPIIVHVSSLEMARQCVAAWPPAAEMLARAFWPGPLTLVLPKSTAIPPVVTAGGNTVGVRFPSHPVIQAVIQACGFPLAAPSANPSNQVSPTTATHVLETLGDKLPLILDGGPCQVGIESTVIDLTSTPPRLLRPGMIPASALLSVLGKIGLDSGQHAPAPAATTASPTGNALRSPGMMKKHYSPKAHLLILAWRTPAEFLKQLQQLAPAIPPAQTHVLCHTQIPEQTRCGRVVMLAREPGAFARSLYAQLHESDNTGARLIVVEAPPPGDAWQAIADRLNRAAAV